MSTPAMGGVAAGCAPNEEVGLADSVRDIAAHLKHAASLALIAAESDEPERGLKYLSAACADAGPPLAALSARLGSLLAAISVAV